MSNLSQVSPVFWGRTMARRTQVFRSSRIMHNQSTQVALTYLDSDNVKRSILKLTAPDYEVMSRKHVDRVVGATRARSYPIDELFRVMKQRLQERNWAVGFFTAASWPPFLRHLTGFP